MKNLKKYHRILSLIFLVPILLIFISGFLLFFRNDLFFLKTPNFNLKKIKQPYVLVEKILENDEIKNFKEKAKITFDIKNNFINIRGPENKEYFFNIYTGELIHQRTRWTTFLIKLHEGNFGILKNIIYLPTIISLMILLITGILILKIYYLPKKRKLNEKSI